MIYWQKNNIDKCIHYKCDILMLGTMDLFHNYFSSSGEQLNKVY